MFKYSDCEHPASHSDAAEITVATSNRDSDHMLAIAHVQLGVSELESSTTASVVVQLGSSSTDSDSDGSCWEPLEPSGCRKAVISRWKDSETQAMGQPEVMAVACLRVKENEGAAALATPIPNVIQKMKSENLEIIQAQLEASRPAAAASTTSTRLLRKRKIDSVDANSNLKLPPQRTPWPATIKRICREKTGTDWQSFLDLAKYHRDSDSRHGEEK